MSQQTALCGVRVLELGRVLACPMVGQMLGDYGAEVLKIERPIEGDEIRGSGTGLPGESTTGQGRNTSGFVGVNRNKKSVTVDFSKPEGRDIILALAKRADILLENFIPGTLTKYGLDYASINALNPRIIYCSLTGFGQTGPLSQQPGYDAIFQAHTGIMSLTGLPDEEPGGGPLRVGFQIVDFAAGMYTTTAALAALQERARSGLGQHIDVALADSGLASTFLKAQEYLVSGSETRQGNRTTNNKWMSTRLICSDGAVNISCNSEAQFSKFCAALGAPEIPEDERYSTAPSRHKNILELQERIETLAKRQTTEELLAACRFRRVPAARVNNFATAFAEPQSVDRGMLINLPHPMDENLKLVANPVRFSRTPVAYSLHPPLLGQHTNEVLSGLLGMDDSRINSLREQGIV